MEINEIIIVVEWEENAFYISPSYLHSVLHLSWRHCHQIQDSGWQSSKFVN